MTDRSCKADATVRDTSVGYNAKALRIPRHHAHRLRDHFRLEQSQKHAPIAGVWDWHERRNRVPRTDSQEADVKKGLIAAGIVILVMGLGTISTYNRLVRLDQAVTAQWGQVENVYQRRADLVPNLVETVKGAAAFEKSTYAAVATARAQVGQVSGEGLANVLKDPAAFERFQQAQAALSSALSRLLVVAERYPDLKATAAFRDLQSQLEGTENRITVERMRFNEAAQAFNTRRQSFPTLLVAGLFGGRFQVKPYFHADEAARVAPKVAF
jgi:LemA protein